MLISSMFGVKINDSAIIYLHDDINNHYSQKYVEDTNILTTNIENTYFNLQIEQIDFVTNIASLVQQYPISSTFLSIFIHFHTCYNSTCFLIC